MDALVADFTKGSGRETGGHGKERDANHIRIAGTEWIVGRATAETCPDGRKRLDTWPLWNVSTKQKVYWC